MKNLTWQNPEQLFVAQELINKVKSKCCGIKDVSEAEGYVFHNNRCIVHNEHCDRFGLLDKQGNYIIQRYDHSGEIINDFYINDVS